MMEIAVLLIALAFVALVIYLILFIKKLTATVGEAQQTLTILTSDLNVTLHHTNEILAKANVLVEDVNSKVATIDPLFTAVADLSESVSDLNTQARHLSVKASAIGKQSAKAGTVYTVSKFASKVLRKKERAHE